MSLLPMHTRFKAHDIGGQRAGIGLLPIAGADGVEADQRSRTGSGQLLLGGRWYQAHPFSAGGLGAGMAIQPCAANTIFWGAHCRASGCGKAGILVPRLVVCSHAAPITHPDGTRPWGFRLTTASACLKRNRRAQPLMGWDGCQRLPIIHLWPSAASNAEPPPPPPQQPTGLGLISGKGDHINGCGAVGEQQLAAAGRCRYPPAGGRTSPPQRAAERKSSFTPWASRGRRRNRRSAGRSSRRRWCEGSISSLKRWPVSRPDDEQARKRSTKPRLAAMGPAQWRISTGISSTKVGWSGFAPNRLLDMLR